MRRGRWPLPAVAMAAATIGALDANAVELFAGERATLNLDLASGAGIFHSEESYALALPGPGEATWQEVFGSIGLSGTLKAGTAGEVYGSASVLSSATWGDGDAAGFTTGDERTTDIENAYLGWRSGQRFRGLGVYLSELSPDLQLDGVR